MKKLLKKYFCKFSYYIEGDWLLNDKEIVSSSSILLGILALPFWIIGATILLPFRLTANWLNN